MDVRAPLWIDRGGSAAACWTTGRLGDLCAAWRSSHGLLPALDEIETSTPQPIELRVHTEGDVHVRDAGRWTFMEGDARLDIVSATKGIHGTIEQLDSRIRPLRAPSLKKPAASAHAVVTVLMPRAAADDQVAMVEQNDAMTLIVNGDRMLFTRAPDGCRFVDVQLRR